MERVPCYAKSIHQNVTSCSHCVWRYVNYMEAIPIRYHGASQRGQRWELHQAKFLYCSLIEDWYWNLNYWMLIITNFLVCGACYEFNFATWSSLEASDSAMPREFGPRSHTFFSTEFHYFWRLWKGNNIILKT